MTYAQTSRSIISSPVTRHLLSSQGIVAWVEKKSGPPAQDLADADAATKLAEDNEVVVIGLFKDKESDAAKEFVKAADSETVKS